jgi:hypothetical protein
VFEGSISTITVGFVGGLIHTPSFSLRYGMDPPSPSSGGLSRTISSIISGLTEWMRTYDQGP